jgi:hypothetical protein
MTKKNLNFSFVEKQIRKKTFGILTTISSSQRPQTSGILYGVSLEDDPFCLYVFTLKSYVKTKNMLNNNNISFLIPYPHHWLRLAPSSTISFQGHAESVPEFDEKIKRAFKQKRVLKFALRKIEKEITEKNHLFFRLIPNKKIICFGVGIGVMKIRNNMQAASYTVEIPRNRKF